MVTGVPAGTAAGVREPVGKIPFLSEVAAKGSCSFVASFSPVAGRLSRCAQPASVIPMNRTTTRTASGTENAATFRQVPCDSIIKQSCRALPRPHKSQVGCHRRGLMYQWLVERQGVGV